jgi:hypothetical protein
VTAIVCPVDKLTVPTEDVTELLAIVGESCSSTDPRVTVELVPVTEILASAVVVNVPADKLDEVPVNPTFAEPVAVAVPTAELTCTPMIASCILIKLFGVPTDKLDEVPVTEIVCPTDKFAEPTAEFTALPATVGASFVVSVPVFEVTFKPLTK